MTTYTIAHKRYYDKRIKPFRKKKEPKGYHSFVCPVCSRRSFMKNLKYNQPFSVDVVFFDGSIKWFKGKFNPEQKKLIIELIKVKLIQSVREFGLTARDLGIEQIEFIRNEIPFIETLSLSENINPKLEMPVRQEIHNG
ncbi:hypothetical protein ES705_31252 [subsurface metagenome]